MKLKQIGSNMTELTLNTGTVILFSYETPVAAVILKNNHVLEIIETKSKGSKSTTRHISKWFDYNFTYFPTQRCNAFTANKVDQSILDALIS